MKPIVGSWPAVAFFYAAWLLTSHQSLGEEVAPSTSMEAARRELKSKADFNWYDRERDSLRPIRIVPRRTSNWFDDWSRPAPAPAPLTIDPSWAAWMENVIWILSRVVLVLLIIALLYFAWRYREQIGVSFADLRRRRTRPSSRAARIEALPAMVASGPLDLLEQAALFASRGEYHLAVVYLFSHQLLQLDRQHRIRLVKGKTNGQYLRELKAFPQLSEYLKTTMLAFEEAYFGGRRLSERRYQNCRAAQQTMDRLLSEEERS